MRCTVIGLLFAVVGCTQQIRDTFTALQPTATPDLSDVDALEDRIAAALLDGRLVLDLQDVAVSDTWNDTFVIWIEGCHPDTSLRQAEAIYAEVQTMIPAIDQIAITLDNLEQPMRHIWRSDLDKWSTSRMTSTDGPC